MAEKRKNNKKVPNLRFPGFKNEWQLRTLKEICKMQAGKFVSAAEISPITNGNLFPCYGGNGLRGYTKSYNQHGKYPLIGRQGALCGNVTLADGKFYATEHAVVVTPKNDMDIDWVFYSLTYLNLNQYATGLAQPGLSVQNLEKLELISPKSMKEQQKISSFLALIDTRIQTQNKIIEQLETLSKELREKLLKRKIRFKGESSNTFPDWRQAPLKNILSIGSGKDYKHLRGGNIPVFGTGGLMTYVDSFLYDGETVCIGRKGTIDKPMYHVGKIWTVDTLFYTHTFINCIPKFAYYIFKSINWLQYNEASGVPSLSKSTIEKIEVHVPSLPEQILIANFLSLIDDKIDSEMKIGDRYERLKKHLLINLFI